MRFILLFFSNTCLAIFMAFFLYKLLKEKVNREDKKKWVFAGFYITILISLSANTLMYFVRNETIIFYYMFVLLLYMTGIFLLDLFLLLKTSFSRIYVYVYLISFVIMLFFQIIIGGVTINEGTNWSPYWSLEMFLYYIFSLTLYFLITLVSFKNIYAKVKEKKQQRIAFKQFFWGLVGVFSTLFLSCAINYFHLVFLQLINLILLLVSPYLMYIGVAKDYIEKKAFSEYFSFLKRKK